MLYESDGRPKGHLSLKSSTLCPNGGKLTSQYLIVDHLVAHYKKLKNVKPTVDTSPPKAWLASQKVRDRIMREALKNGMFRQEWFLAATDRAYIRPSSLRTSEFDRSDMLARMHSLKLQNDDMDGMAMSAHQNKLRQDSHTATYRQHSETAKLENADKSKNSGRDYGEELKNKLRSQIFETTKYPSDSDLIKIRKHMFTEGKPFTPRTLKTNMSSKLVQQGCYNPPKRKSKNPREKARRMENTLDGNTTKSLGDTIGFNDTLLTDTMRSYDGRAHSAPSGVPLLDISLDTDNLRWLKEQSRIIEAKQVPVQLTASEPAVVSEEKRRNVSPTGPQYQSVPQKHHISARDEELMYLNFIKDVTKDILDRGIFTNRALKQVFESHVAKHKDELKLSKMHDMIKDLRTDLGIPEFDHPEDEGFGFNSSKKFTKSDFSPPGNVESNDSTLMTRQMFDLKQFKGTGRRGSRGLNLNSRTALHDVLEVQEDDLSGESGRAGELRKKERRAGEGSDDEASIANDTLRSEGNSTLGFDEIDSDLGKTQLIYRNASDQKKLSPKNGDLHSKLFEKGDSKKLSVGLEKQKEEERKASEAALSRESSARRKRRTPEHMPRKPFDQKSQSSTPFSSPEHMAIHSPADTDRSLELQVVMYEDGHQPDIQMVETKLKNQDPLINSPHKKLDSPKQRIKSPASKTNSPVPKTKSPVPKTNSPAPKTNSPVPKTNSPVPKTNSPVPKTNSPVPKVRSSQLKAKTPEPDHNDKPLHVEYASSDQSELARSGLPAVSTISERKFSPSPSPRVHSNQQAISERKLSPSPSPRMHSDHQQVDSKAKEEEGGETTRTVENDGFGFDDDSSEFLDTLGEYKHSLEMTDNYDNDDFDEDDEEIDEKRTGVERSPRPSNPLNHMEQMNDDF